MKTDVKDDGEEAGVTREAQQKKCEHLTPNTDTTALMAATIATKEHDKRHAELRIKLHMRALDRMRMKAEAEA